MQDGILLQLVGTGITERNGDSFSVYVVVGNMVLYIHRLRALTSFARPIFCAKVCAPQQTADVAFPHF